MRARNGQAGALCAIVALLLGAPAAGAATTEYSLPPGDGAAAPSGVAAGPDGAVWFTEREGGAIGRITTSGSVQEFPLPDPDPRAKQPTDIVRGPDNALWFTLAGVDRIGRITTAGVVTEYGGLVPGAEPSDLAVGPDGNIWFTEAGYNRGNHIGRIDPATGAVTEFCIRPPSPSRCSGPEHTADAGLWPRGITRGPDGRMWFALQNPDGSRPDPYGDIGTGYIGAVDMSGNVEEFALPTANSQPFGVAAGPDGNVWYSAYGVNKVGRMTPAGEQIVEFELANPGSGPLDITTGPDGNLWFTQFLGNRLGRITPDGAVTDSPALAEANSRPNRLAVGPDGALWFAESSVDKIGRQTADAAPIVKPLGVEDATAETVRMLGSVNPSGSATKYLVHYGFTTDFGSTSPAQDAGSGREAIDVDIVLKGLDPSSIYYYRWEASNPEGTTRSSIGTFTTAPPAFEYPPYPPYPPPPPPPPPPVRPVPDGLGLKLMRPKPRKQPRRFLARGRLHPPADEEIQDPCLEAVVSLAVRKRRVIVRKRRVKRRIVRKKVVRYKRVYRKTTALEENCTYRTKLRLKRKVAPPGRFRVRTRFVGNQELAPKRSRRRALKIVPRKKLKQAAKRRRQQAAERRQR